MAQEYVVGYGAGTDGSGALGGNNQTNVRIKPDAYYDMMLLKMLRQMEFHYAKYAIQKSLPRNYGDKINWRRFKKLEVADNLGLLTEGQTPVGKTGIQGEEITAVIHQYGEVMYFTDLVDLQQLDDVRREYTIELGYIAQETLDTIVRNTLVAEGSVFYANALASVNAVSAATADARPKIDDFRKIILGFKKDFVSGVRGASGRYIALVSPEVMFALFDDERMIQYMSFGQNNGPLMDGMIVDLFGIRFEEVLNAPVLGNAHDSIILADEAYAITKLQGEGNVRVITKGLGSAGVEDPLDQRQSIGYKITGFGTKVLRSESVVNYWSNPAIAGTVDLTSITQNAGERADVKAVNDLLDLTDANQVPTNTKVFIEFLAGDTGVSAAGYAVVARTAALSVAIAAGGITYASGQELEGYYLDAGLTQEILSTKVLNDQLGGGELTLKVWVKSKASG